MEFCISFVCSNWKLDLENGIGIGNRRLEIRTLEIGRLEIEK